MLTLKSQDRSLHRLLRQYIDQIHLSFDDSFSRNVAIFKYQRHCSSIVVTSSSSIASFTMIYGVFHTKFLTVPLDIFYKDFASISVTKSTAKYMYFEVKEPPFCQHKLTFPMVILIILAERAKPLGFILPQSSYHPFWGWFGPITWPLARPSSAPILVAVVGSLELPTVSLPVEFLDLDSNHLLDIHVAISLEQFSALIHIVRH